MGIRSSLSSATSLGIGLLFVGLVSGANAERPAPMKAVPINSAEAIFEPFWEPSLSGLSKWRIDDGKAHGLGVEQTWASVQFQWVSKPAQGSALRMSREFNLDCDGYDRLLIAMTAPEGAAVSITAVTNAGERTSTSGASEQKAAEYELDLRGASRIDSLTIEITASREGTGAGWFKWIGLQNTSQLERYRAEYDFSQMQWDAQLKEDGFEPDFKPRYGIFISEEELAELRIRDAKAKSETGSSPSEQRAASLRDLQPERGIGQFANSGGRTNRPHARVRDAAGSPVGDGITAAELGLVLKDKALLRVAARCALSLAASEKWDEGFLDNFPGSAWELRSFRRGYVCQDIARIMDLAGEMFTEAGRTYLLRRLAEEGVGPTNYITWRYDYIFQCNQMTFYGRGRLAAYLVMEREWPRVKPYTDLAIDELKTLFDNLVMSDGGLLEPPTYAIGTIRSGCRMFDTYAQARRADLKDVVPASIARSGDYAAAVASTVAGADVIPYGDSGTTLDVESLVTFASLAPRGSWVTLLRKKLTEKDARDLPFVLRRKLEMLPSKTPAMPAFVRLPSTGLAASMREFNGEPVKLFIRGNHGTRFHSHEHEDTGSFVLEYAGEAFAMDPGIAEYDDPRHQFMKQADWHNMLVPIVEGERATPEVQCETDVTPAAKGGRKAFHAKLDATPPWKKWFAKWIRTWDSPTPDGLTIRDEYRLNEGSGVRFCWQTGLACSVVGDSVIISGKRGGAILRPERGCRMNIEELPVIGDVAQKRISFEKSGREGTIEISVGLLANN